jgi:hypothetical protein
VALFAQTRDEVRAEEPSATGDEDAHARKGTRLAV